MWDATVLAEQGTALEKKNKKNRLSHARTGKLVKVWSTTDLIVWDVIQAVNFRTAHLSFMNEILRWWQQIGCRKFNRKRVHSSRCWLTGMTQTIKHPLHLIKSMYAALSTPLWRRWCFNDTLSHLAKHPENKISHPFLTFSVWFFLWPSRHLLL